ncbi:hypothetical protein B0H11DRAFT_2271979 [Mycena galericulata]|nr:hypothetical protein B0H11DRAFT_2271979 [Mycena galericulata]
MADCNRILDSGSEDAPIFDIHPLALRLLKLVSWVLLFVPSYLSAVLPVPQDGFVSGIVLLFTFIGLQCIAATLATMTVVYKLSPRCRLIEPLAFCLVLPVGFLSRPPKDPNESSLSHSPVVHMLLIFGVIFPALWIQAWNQRLHKIDRADRVVDAKYLGSLCHEVFSFRKSTHPGLANMAVDGECLPLYATDLDTTKGDSGPSSHSPTPDIKPADEAV